MIRRALELAQVVRDLAPEAPILWGGVHVGLLPEQSLHHPLVDLVARGEGEDTLLHLADALSKGGDLSRVPGLSFLDGDRFPSRQWDGIALDTDGSLLLSPPRAGGGPPLYGVRDEDIIRCRPSATDPSGVIINCTYEGYFDGSLLNIGVGVNLQDFDLAGDRSIVFVSSGRLALPPNEPGEDLLRYDGPVRRRVGRPRDLPPRALAGLDGVTIGGVSFAPRPTSTATASRRRRQLRTSSTLTRPTPTPTRRATPATAPHRERQAGGVHRQQPPGPGRAGGLNDQVKKLKAFVSLEAVRPHRGRRAHVMIRHALGRRASSSARHAAGDGNWRQLIGRPSSCAPPAPGTGGFRRATLKSVGGSRHKLALQSVPLSLHDLPVTPGKQLRITLEVSTRSFTGACFERLLRCTGRGRHQTCR
jgi:hypothetical protein